MSDTFARVMSMPSEVVARRRLRSILRQPTRFASGEPLNVHRLRVSIRQAEAAIDLFNPCIEPGAADDYLAGVGRLRRIGGRVRDADTHLAILDELGRASNAGAIRGWTKLRAAAAADRTESGLVLARRVRADELKALRGRRRRTLDAIIPPDEGVASWGRLIAVSLRPMVDAVRASLPDHRDAAEPRLHELRLAVKRVRYALAIVGDETPVEPLPAALACLESAQVWLGGVADASSMHERACEAAQFDPDLLEIRGRLGEWRERRRAECLGWLLETGNVAILGALASVIAEVASLVPTPAAALVPLTVDERPNVSSAAWVEPPPRVAVVDLGSNSIRLLVSEITAGGPRVVEEAREPVRLAEGLERGGVLSSSAIDRAAGAVSVFCDRAIACNVSVVRVVATAAARRATNQPLLVSAIADGSGRALEVLDEVEEGRLAFLGVTHALDPGVGHVAVVDIGGGSTEIVLASRGVPYRVRSIPIGAVGLTERFEIPGESAKRAWKRMRQSIAEELRGLNREVRGFAPRLIATGGSAAAIAILAGVPESAPIDADVLGGVAKAIRALSPLQRSAIPGLAADRGVLILAGLAILVEVMDAIDAREVRVASGGVRHGVILDLSTPRVGMLDEARSLALRCGWNPAGGDREARFAGVLADEFCRGIDDAREIAAAACMLRDAGLVASVRRVAKRSRGVVLASALRAHWPRQAAAVALLVGQSRARLDDDAKRVLGCITLARRLAALAGAETVRVRSASPPSVVVSGPTRPSDERLERCRRCANKHLGVGVEWEQMPADRVARHAARGSRAPARPLPSVR